MLERDFAIVCDRGCDLPPLYLERAQATLVGAVAQTLGTPLGREELTDEFVRTYQRLAEKGFERVASVHSSESFSPEIQCARTAAAAVSDVVDVQVIDSGSASAATGMVLFRLACSWAAGVPFSRAVASARELSGHVRLLVIPSQGASLARRRTRHSRLGLLGRATSSLRVRISNERSLYLVAGGDVTPLARSAELPDLTGKLAHAMSAVSANEGSLVYTVVCAGDQRALRMLEKPLDTNEFESHRLGTVRATPPVEMVIGSGAVGVGFAPADAYWGALDPSEAPLKTVADSPSEEVHHE